MLGILRSILLSCSAASLLAAQPRPVPGTPDLPPGYRRLADVTDLKGPLAKAITLDLAQVPLKDILRQIATQAGLSYAADPAQRGMEVRRAFKVNAIPAHRAIAMLLEGRAKGREVLPLPTMGACNQFTERPAPSRNL